MEAKLYLLWLRLRWFLFATPISIYIRSPYTIGNRETNAWRSIIVADKLFCRGFVPFAPLTHHWWEIKYCHSFKEWIEFDLYWQAKCDIAIRLRGKSIGADIEEVDGLSRGMPQYTNLKKLYSFFYWFW